VFHGEGTFSLTVGSGSLFSGDAYNRLSPFNTPRAIIVRTGARWFCPFVLKPPQVNACQKPNWHRQIVLLWVLALAAGYRCSMINLSICRPLGTDMCLLDGYRDAFLSVYGSQYEACICRFLAKDRLDLYWSNCG
jgi:hypothetical protein